MFVCYRQSANFGDHQLTKKADFTVRTPVCAVLTRSVQVGRYLFLVLAKYVRYPVYNVVLEAGPMLAGCLAAR